ncbi:hypothetical protein ACNPQM_30580 [Streptomyces sp. NPDC056231]|uniref:hypothetical protein n=1 Tax=Streptomyces sp. NPDC056231 TaxID=3345755 RepID=UPI003AB0CC12
MRTVPHPRTGEGTAVPAALATAPRAYRPAVAGALVGAATAAHRRAGRQAARRLAAAAEAADASWFTIRSLEGFTTS